MSPGLPLSALTRHLPEAALEGQTSAFVILAAMAQRDPRGRLQPRAMQQGEQVHRLLVGTLGTRQFYLAVVPFCGCLRESHPQWR